MNWAALLSSLRSGARAALRGHHAADVDDVTHDAAIRLLARLRAHGIESDACAYAFAVGRTTAIDWLRSRRSYANLCASVQHEPAAPTCAPSCESQVLDRAVLRYLDAALGGDLDLFASDRPLNGAERAKKMRRAPKLAELARELLS